MVADFQPLVRIARTAFPYWLIAAVLVSVLAAFIAKKSNRVLSLLAAVGETVGTFVCACALLFVLLGCYVQLTGSAMSFVQLLPSSFLIGMGFSAASVLMSDWSEAEAGPGVLVGAFAFFSVASGIFLAFVVSFFPKVIAFQWHLLKLL